MHKFTMRDVIIEMGRAVVDSFGNTTPNFKNKELQELSQYIFSPLNNRI